MFHRQSAPARRWLCACRAGRDLADLTVRPHVLRVLTSGDFAIRDAKDVMIVYPVVAGKTLQISAVGVEATATTATDVGWL